MARIIQQKIFSRKAVEVSGELERLKMVIEAIPDDNLMEVLEAERKGRRDDYPIRPAWNSILAEAVYQHVSIESNPSIRSIRRFWERFCDKIRKRVGRREEYLRFTETQQVSKGHKSIPSRGFIEGGRLRIESLPLNLLATSRNCRQSWAVRSACSSRGQVMSPMSS
ncbi:MAG: hypothetical protein ABR903_04175 [Thermodesulfovibrionales bacterium]|jgi:hypothetical protein